jgi:hypothetical protein
MDSDTIEDTAEAELGTAMPNSPAESDATDSEVPTRESADDEDQGDEEPESFPREVVEKLRHENAKYRQRAQQADTLARRLHTELVRATGRLADPTDLEFDEEHLDDPDALTSAIGDLLDRKPHLASRRPVGDVGQGNRGSSSEPFSLLGLLKERR